MCFVRISTKNLCCVLTFVAYPEADVGVALVSWEEQVEEVGGADKKLGHLGALIASNQRRRGETSVAHLQDVVVDFSAEPANKRTLRNHCLASAGQKKKIEQQDFKTKRWENKNNTHGHFIFTKVQEEDIYFKRLPWWCLTNSCELPSDCLFAAIQSASVGVCLSNK